MEKFSVLMSLYHKENPKFLEESLDSIYSNTIKPDQVVLILDGPIGKDLQNIVTKYRNKYSSLEIYPQEKNKGLSTALNIGLQKCKYDIVFRMDTDDICYPDRFEKMLALYDKDPELDLAGSWATMIDKDGHESKIITTPCRQEDIYIKIWTCPFYHPTMTFKKSSLLNVGSYNPKSGPRQDDYELWFRCVAAGLKCMNLGEPLLYYRFFDDSIAKNSIEVGWWRMKVGLKGCWICHCSPIAYIGVCYPLFRALMPAFIQKWLYAFTNKHSPRR